MKWQFTMKTLKTTGIIILSLMALLILQVIITNGERNADGSDTDTDRISKFETVDKIQVVHFHATQQCWSCITVGEYALNTIKDKFPEEYANGMIEFIEVNLDLAENSEIVDKFGASGSSLFINVISEGNDNISEDVAVWRLVGSETSFVKYFEGKLSGYLN